MWWICFIGKQLYTFSEGTSVAEVKSKQCEKYAGMCKVYGPYTNKWEAQEALPATKQDLLRGQKLA